MPPVEDLESSRAAVRHGGHVLARDGEGATKLLRATVQGAATEVDAAVLSASEDVRSAIENAPACNQPVPGMPQGPAAPPKGGTRGRDRASGGRGLSL